MNMAWTGEEWEEGTGASSLGARGWVCARAEKRLVGEGWWDRMAIDLEDEDGC